MIEHPSNRRPGAFAGVPRIVPAGLDRQNRAVEPVEQSQAARADGVELRQMHMSVDEPRRDEPLRRGAAQVGRRRRLGVRFRRIIGGTNLDDPSGLGVDRQTTGDPFDSFRGVGPNQRAFKDHERRVRREEGGEWAVKRLRPGS